MAGERCNLDKDEAELLKPSSSSSPPPAPPPTSPPTPQPSANPTPPPLFLAGPHELPPPVHRDRPAMALAANAVVSLAVASGEAQPPIRSINRCSSCRKKVGLTGFRCRCGELFCGRHRYSDAHDCSFDYKALGREEISRNNPVVRAAKILKI